MRHGRKWIRLASSVFSLHALPLSMAVLMKIFIPSINLTKFTGGKRQRRQNCTTQGVDRQVEGGGGKCLAWDLMI